jgi:hypothetical protein
MADDVVRLDRMAEVIRGALEPVAHDLVFSVVGCVTSDGLVLVNIHSRFPGHDDARHPVVQELRDLMATLLRDAVGGQENDMIRLTHVSAKA